MVSAFDDDDSDDLMTRNLLPRPPDPTPDEDLSTPFYEISASARAADALEAALEYAHACDDALHRANPWERLSGPKAKLAQEADTWRLLHCLLADERNDIRDSPVREDYASPHDVIAARFAVDKRLRLMQTVVDWLERCAERQSRAIPGAGSLHWENTLHELQADIKDERLVTRLDPDAPRRQGKSPLALDKKDDDNLCEAIFGEIRRGRFDDAVALCVDAGQAWRAVILHGHRPLRYPAEPVSDDAHLPPSGNASRALWKRTCLDYLKSPVDNSHFAAALGILCGHLPSAVPVCRDTREDLLWAHLRVQIELRVDRLLSEAGAIDSVEFESELYERTREMDLRAIFQSVESSFTGANETPYQDMQRGLILDAIGGPPIDPSAFVDSSDAHLSRFSCHLALVLRRVGKETSREAGDRAIRAYVDHLIATKDACPDTIAHYVSKLPALAQIAPCADMMSLAERDAARNAIAEAADRAGIDVRAAALETVRRGIASLDRPPPDASFRFDADAYETIATKAVSQLDWLALYDDQVRAAVATSNAIIRRLVFRGDVESATAAMAKLVGHYSSDAIAKTLDADSNSLREHFCLKAYLEAIDGYATWYRRQIGGRPKSPELPPQNCSFTEKVHHEQLRAQTLVQRDRWAATGVHQANHVKQLLYNVLMFPEGWGADDPCPRDEATADDDDAREWIDRRAQLDSLRRLCVPEIVLLLIKVLQSGGAEGHVEAIRLSELLASEKRKLYSLFPKQKLREVLHKIGESSLYVLENNRDPWGFESRVAE